MPSVVGVTSLYRIVPCSDKPSLHKVAATLLAAAVVPLSCSSVWRGVSRDRALVVLATATRSSVISEEAFKGLGGHSFTESPLENGLACDHEGEEGYEPEETVGGGSDYDDVPIANLVVPPPPPPPPPQQLMGSPKNRRIIHLFPSQEAMQPRAVRRPWYSFGGASTLIAAANAMQLFPSKALAQMCDATLTQQAVFMAEGLNTTCHHFHRLVLMDLDPATAKLVISIIGPLLSAYGFLFILRIVMSWYPKIPVSKFPYVIAYAPTEPLLIPTRKLIPPLGGVDVTPVVWFGLISFLNEILVGPQGLLVLLSQQV